jgi:hypothetical protein
LGSWEPKAAVATGPTGASKHRRDRACLVEARVICAGNGRAAQRAARAERRY